MAIFDRDESAGREEFRDVFEALRKKTYAVFIKAYSQIWKAPGFKEKLDKVIYCRKMSTNILNVKNPLEQPREFGLALGAFFYVLKYDKVGLFLEKKADVDMMLKIIEHLRSIDGFDMKLLKKRIAKSIKNLESPTIQTIGNAKVILNRL